MFITDVFRFILITLAVFTFLVIHTPLTQASIDVKDVPQEVRDALLREKVYIEEDGLTKWRLRDDGAYVKYWFGRDVVNKVFYPNGDREVYETDGTLVLKEQGNKDVIYTPEGNIDEINEDDRIIYYEDGVRVRIENPIDGEGRDEVSARKINNTSYQLQWNDTILFITTDDTHTVRTARHSTAFEKDFEIADDNTRRLIDPITNDVLWGSNTGGGLWHTIQAYIIRWFYTTITTEGAQLLLDKTFFADE